VPCARSERPVRLACGALRVHLDDRGVSLLDLASASISRDRTDQWTNAPFDLVAGPESVVQPFDHEGRSHSEDEAHQQTENDVANDVHVGSRLRLGRLANDLPALCAGRRGLEIEHVLVEGL
jgi:hypothetical protein